MADRQKFSGFVLIELVMTLILVGIIGTFTGFFLYTGTQGYLTSKKTSEGALRAQTVLERISKELTDIEGLQTGSPVLNSSVSYTSRLPSLPGQRSISFNEDTDVLSITVDGNTYPLLKDVDGFWLSWSTADLNNDGTDEISGLTLAFNTKEIGQVFSTTIYPRRFLPAP